MDSPSDFTTAGPRLISTGAAMRELVLAARRDSRTIGLVPTMGALHEGHLSLVRRARQQCDCVAVSIYVNPTQFAPHEDFDKYPRTLEADLAALAREQVDWVFVPQNQEMYPAGFSTYIEPPRVAQPLEGHCRPGHFRGVATVVLKLFQLLPADIAFFGQKDYQQYLVIRNMATDLNLPIRIEVGPTVREPDGLALSSRNRYLQRPEREQAVAISQSLRLAVQLVRDGQRQADAIRSRMRDLLTTAGITRVDYVAIADADTLEELDTIDRPAVALVAAYVGQTRLIDNQRIEL